MQLQVTRQEIELNKEADENLLQSDRIDKGQAEVQNLLDAPDEIQESDSPRSAKLHKVEVGNYDDNMEDEEEESKVHFAQHNTAGISNRSFSNNLA